MKHTSYKHTFQLLSLKAISRFNELITGVNKLYCKFVIGIVLYCLFDIVLHCMVLYCEEYDSEIKKSVKWGGV